MQSGAGAERVSPSGRQARQLGTEAVHYTVLSTLLTILAKYQCDNWYCILGPRIRSLFNVSPGVAQKSGDFSPVQTSFGWVWSVETVELLAPGCYEFYWVLLHRAERPPGGAQGFPARRPPAAQL